MMDVLTMDHDAFFCRDGEVELTGGSIKAIFSCLVFFLG